MPAGPRKQPSSLPKSGGAPVRPEATAPPRTLSASGTKPGNMREVRGAARREAILGAALDEFSARGFAAARLDDVARRAGVAKGTIYLYFADKETLFQELVRSMLTPLIGHFETLAATEMPFPALADRLVDIAAREVIGSRRRDIIRLIISEGPRFPAIADFYYREVLSRVLSALRAILQRACDRGELRHRGLAEFPQLLAAPVLVGIVWNSLFETQAPLDAGAMLKAHIDILLDRDGGWS